MPESAPDTATRSLHSLYPPVEPAPVAEREGFEPPIRLPVCRISSAVLSTTQPPLRSAEPRADALQWCTYLAKPLRRNKSPAGFARHASGPTAGGVSRGRHGAGRA